MNHIEAMKQALEALESCTPEDTSTGHVVWPSYDEQAVEQAITDLRTAIEQAEKQEPYRVEQDLYGEEIKLYTTPPAAPVQEPSEALRLAMDWYDSGHEDREEFKAMMENLLVAPAAQRQWVGLTDEEIMELLAPLYSDPSLVPWAIEVSMDEYRAIEAKLREKNGGLA